MKCKFIEDSIVNLKKLSSNASDELSSFIYAIEAAPSIKELISLLSDDVVSTSKNKFHILIKDNYQHVAACIEVTVENKNDATINFQVYD